MNAKRAPFDERLDLLMSYFWPSLGQGAPVEYPTPDLALEKLFDRDEYAAVVKVLRRSLDEEEEKLVRSGEEDRSWKTGTKGLRNFIARIEAGRHA